MAFDDAYEKRFAADRHYSCWRRNYTQHLARRPCFDQSTYGCAYRRPRLNLYYCSVPYAIDEWRTVAVVPTYASTYRGNLDYPVSSEAFRRPINSFMRRAGGRHSLGACVGSLLSPHSRPYRDTHMISPHERYSVVCESSFLTETGPRNVYVCV